MTASPRRTSLSVEGAISNFVREMYIHCSTSLSGHLTCIVNCGANDGMILFIVEFDRVLDFPDIRLYSTQCKGVTKKEKDKRRSIAEKSLSNFLHCINISLHTEYPFHSYIIIDFF